MFWMVAPSMLKNFTSTSLCFPSNPRHVVFEHTEFHPCCMPGRDSLIAATWMEQNRSTERINDLAGPEIESRFPKTHSSASTTNPFLGKDQEVYHTFFLRIYSIKSLQKGLWTFLLQFKQQHNSVYLEPVPNRLETNQNICAVQVLVLFLSPLFNC